MALARPWLIAAAAAASAALTLAPAVSANAQQASGARSATVTGALPASRACPPAGFAVSFSDSLDKLVYHGAALGGLSSLAWDARSAAWVGDYLVSSETEPSIRIYGRDGVQKASLPIPAWFAVTGTTPDGRATSNATLEGLTISRSGHEIISSMEGALSRPAATPLPTGSWSTTRLATGPGS